MKKEVLLVLGILEGRGWHPIDGHKTIIEAHLDNHKLSTDAFPLTNAPKFNTEITWEAEKQTIRSYKLNRVPIKIECYSLDEKNNRKSLGYIVLPLTSAVEGVEVDSKWHKLLGGPTTTYKTPPSILLRLHLEAMTLDQQSQMNGKQMTAFRNGQHTTEDDKMSCLLEKNKFIQNREGVEMRPTQTNVNKKGSKDETKQAALPLVQNSHHLKATNGVSGDDGKVLDEMDCDMEEDMLDYDSEGFSNADPNDTPGIIVEAYSLAEPVNEGNSNTSFNGNGEQQRTNEKSNQKFVEDKEIETDAVKKGKSNIENSSTDKSEDATLETDRNSKSFEKNSSDHESLLKSRSSAREYLQTLSRSLHTSNSQKGSPTSIASITSSHDINSSLEKRILDTSHMLDESYEQRNKSRKVDSSMEESFSKQIGETKGKVSDEADISLLKSRLAHDHSATSTAFFLAQSVGENYGTKMGELPGIKDLRCKKLVPYLNQEGGYFSIGPRDGETEEEFTFSVTIIYAKNLHKILSQDIIPSLKKKGFRFCYSLLGYSVYTDPFIDLDNPEFLAEKASAVIRSSHESLSKYFSEHYVLPVHFLSGETSLGVCTVSIVQLIDIANKVKAKVEGVFEMNPVGKVPSRSSDNSNSKAMIALSFEVSKSNDDGAHFSRQSRKVVNFITEESLGRSHNELVVSDSMSSGSDCDEDRFIKRKIKTHGGMLCYSCKNHFSKREERLQSLKVEREIERQKKALLHEAAYEVERWKEEQEKHFLREWTAKEETLQKLIASEWNSKIKIIEGELSHRLSECDKLQEKLNSALSELSIREEKLRFRENQVTQLEQELNSEKEKMVSLTKMKTSQPREATDTQDQILAKQLETEKERGTRFQNEVSKLQEQLMNSEENLKAQTQEIISLRRKLIQSDDIIGISKEKEALANKIESLQERKQYYKTQWLNAITDLHKLHSAHKKTIDEITSDMKSCSPQEFYTHDKSPLREFSSATGYKLRKLKDERKILLESGLYPYNHSIIKSIDKKIKELLG